MPREFNKLCIYNIICHLFKTNFEFPLYLGKKFYILFDDLNTPAPQMSFLLFKYLFIHFFINYLLYADLLWARHVQMLENSDEDKYASYNPGVYVL